MYVCMFNLFCIFDFSLVLIWCPTSELPCAFAFRRFQDKPKDATTAAKTLQKTRCLGGGSTLSAGRSKLPSWLQGWPPRPSRHIPRRLPRLPEVVLSSPDIWQKSPNAHLFTRTPKTCFISLSFYMTCFKIHSSFCCFDQSGKQGKVRMVDKNEKGCPNGSREKQKHWKDFSYRD